MIQVSFFNFYIFKIKNLFYFFLVTNLPYATSLEFKIFREAYYDQLELLEESEKTEEIKKFIEWRKNIQKNNLSIIIKSETPLLNVDDSM